MSQASRVASSQQKKENTKKDNVITIKIQEITLLYLIMSHKTVLIFFNMIQNQLILQGYYPERKILLIMNDSEKTYSDYMENLHKYYRNLLYREKIILESDLNNSQNDSQNNSQNDSHRRSVNRKYKEMASISKDNKKEYFDYFSKKSVELGDLIEKLNKIKKNNNLYNYYDKLDDILNKRNTKDSDKYENLRIDINILKKIVKKLLDEQLIKHHKKTVKINKSQQNMSNISEHQEYMKMLETKKNEYHDPPKIKIKFIKPKSDDRVSISSLFHTQNDNKETKIYSDFKDSGLSKSINKNMKRILSLRELIDETYNKELQRYEKTISDEKFRKREVFKDLNNQIKYSLH